MRKLLFLLIIALALPVAAQDEVRNYTGFRWFDDHIAFDYPTSIGEIGFPFFYPAVDEAGLTLPERIEINFERYEEDTGWLRTGASISIALISTFPDDDQPAAQVLNRVRAIVDAEDFESASAGGIPLFSPLTGELVATEDEARLGFQTGSGVRFATADGNYVFQGVTDDDAYFVSAVFPRAAADMETLDAIIESLHVTDPEASLLTADTDGVVDFEGIQFSYDPALAYRVEVDSTAAITGEEAENSMYGPSPGYREITLIGYPVAGRFVVPQLFVMPVSEFPGPDRGFGAELARLQSLLEEHPALTSMAELSGTNPEALPMLPLINAAQVIVSHPQYVEFEGGQGVRYVAYYSQEAAVIAANELFYVFVGITDDDNYVIGARFPVNISILPAEVDYSTLDYDQFLADYKTYIPDILAQIDALADSDFDPALSELDALVASLHVD